MNKINHNFQNKSLIYKLIISIVEHLFAQSKYLLKNMNIIL